MNMVVCWCEVENMNLAFSDTCFISWSYSILSWSLSLHWPTTMPLPRSVTLNGKKWWRHIALPPMNRYIWKSYRVACSEITNSRCSGVRGWGHWWLQDWVHDFLWDGVCHPVQDRARGAVRHHQQGGVPRGTSAGMLWRICGRMFDWVLRGVQWYPKRSLPRGTIPAVCSRILWSLQCRRSGAMLRRAQSTMPSWILRAVHRWRTRSMPWGTHPRMFHGVHRGLLNGAEGAVLRVEQPRVHCWDFRAMPWRPAPGMLRSFFDNSFIRLAPRIR